uniref:Uncharacterized protein n=1 Tax=Oryzias melastigma TaxID=30732 RepID=A0A3B3CNW9_ORYME
MDLKESCGSQGSHESSSLHPSSWQAFVHTSTLHGLRYIFPYGQCSVRRLLWAAALLACLGLLALESAERMAYFLSFPHVTSLDAVVSSSLVFPAVTICNLNAYRFSSLTRNDLYHAGELLALLDVHLAIPQPHLAEPDVLAVLQEKVNFTAYKPKAFNMKEFIDRVGHDLKEMISSLLLSWSFYVKAFILLTNARKYLKSECCFFPRSFCLFSGNESMKVEKFTLSRFF